MILTTLAEADALAALGPGIAAGLRWLHSFDPLATQQDIRGLLGKMLFKGEEGMKPTDALSGGEAVRMIFSKLMLAKDNVLVLDEPTNHLDLESIIALGDGFTWRSKDDGQTREPALAQWERCQRDILAGEHDVLILDEFTYPMHYGWIAVEDVLDVLRQRREMMHIVITGRHAPAELIEYADLVTEMKLIKHPYREQGIKAQPGIEF